MNKLLSIIMNYDNYSLFVWWRTIKRYVFIEWLTGQERFEIGPLFTAFNVPSCRALQLWNFRENCVTISPRISCTPKFPRKFPPKLVRTSHQITLLLKVPRTGENRSALLVAEARKAHFCARNCAFLHNFSHNFTTRNCKIINFAHTAKFYSIW